jgi:hypothetical protein
MYPPFFDKNPFDSGHCANIIGQLLINVVAELAGLIFL